MRTRSAARVKCSKSRECTFSMGGARPGAPRETRASAARKRSRSNCSARARRALGWKHASAASKRLHGGRQPRDALLVEQEPGGRRLPAGRHDRLQGPARGQGDHRAPGGHGLEGDDAEVLAAGEEHGPALAVEARDLRVAAPAEELDGRSGEGAQAGLLGAGPHDQEPPPERRGRADGQIDALVRHECRDDEVEVALGAVGQLEALDVDGRIDDRRLAPVAAADARRARARRWPRSDARGGWPRGPTRAGPGPGRAGPGA